MPRRLFRRLSPPRHRVVGQPWLRPLRSFLDHPDLWAIRRRAVAPGVALGLFWMWMPIPGHSLAAGLSAIGLRVHLPLAMLVTMIVNPVTIFPLYYSGYRFGQSVLGTPELITGPITLDTLMTQIGLIWQPLFAGCILLGIATAALGFLFVELAWRTRIGQYLQARRARRLARRQRS
ncbi:MAG: DUF2062 domain-containing protein [Pseudomonadota bacterium]